MRWFRHLASCLVLNLLVTAQIMAAATTARLVLPVESVKPGDRFLAGVELTMKPGWHTYWRYGGDSGAATTVEWQLPPGITAGSIQWPAPEIYSENDLTTYVYHGTILLLVPITVDESITPGPVQLSADVRWLECEKLCVPGRGSIQGQFTVGTETRPSLHQATLELAAAKLPKPVNEGSVTAHWDGPDSMEERPLIIRWQLPTASGTPDFLPYGDAQYEMATAVDRLPSEPGVALLRKKVRRIEGEWPEQIQGLLVLMNSLKQPAFAAEATLTLRGSAPNLSSSPSAGTGSGGFPGSSSGSVLPALPALSLPVAITFAFLGGVILNVMPCVLPVIALKILGFVRQGHNHPAEVRKHGLIYGLGVWFSFLVLAGAVVAVKQTAGNAGWGMQFGNPIFLVAMTTLVLLVALSLFGVFEIQLAGRALDSAGDLAARSGTAGSFFNGMLAVALATPCTAPFLAPALGYAFVADSLTIVLIFSAVAFGLAAPYVILSWQPAWLRFLPKPGAWMERFKVAMGFPMLGTAIWLYALSADFFGPAGTLWLGVFLVSIALAAWIWGEFVQRGRRHQRVAMIVAAAVVLIAYLWPLERELQWRSPSAEPFAVAGIPSHVPSEGIDWKPWSREAVAAAQEEGRPVLVDFTANWCWTCKLNERTSIEIEPVREKLKAINAVALKGDYTRLPPAITEELQRFRRAGVPLVVVYPKDTSREPIVLPELLTPRIVLDALEQAAI